MYLWELFNNFDDDDASTGGFVDKIRQNLIDVLTPLAAAGAPFVTVQSVMDQLQKMRTGIDVDRGLIMQVLDPASVKLITKIEGDRIFFTLPDSDTREVEDRQKQKDAKKVAQTASKQAQKNVAS